MGSDAGHLSFSALEIKIGMYPDADAFSTNVVSKDKTCLERNYLKLGT